MPPKSPALKTEAFVKWFRAATPYIHRWGGATFVIAFGGEVLADGEFQQLTHDINVLVSLDVRVPCTSTTRTSRLTRTLMSCVSCWNSPSARTSPPKAMTNVAPPQRWM